MNNTEHTPVRRRLAPWTGRAEGHALAGVLLLLVGACASETLPADGGNSSPSTQSQAGQAATSPSSPPSAANAAANAATPVGAAGAKTVSAGSNIAGTQPGAAQPGAAQPDSAAGNGASILPCAVSKSLASNCQSCHGATPIGGAPMPLVTYADLMKPASTAPDKKVYELVQTRIHDTARPMPPNAKLADPDMSALDSWLQGGVPTGGTSDAQCDVGTSTHGGSDTIKAGARGPRDFTTGRLTPTAEETCYDFKVHGSTTSVDDSKFDVPDGEQYEQFYYNVPWPAGQVATAYATVADNAQVLHHWLLFSTNEQQAEGNHITAPLPTLIGADPVLLAGWAVGGPNVVAPDDVGFELPDPGRTINVQWHFYNSTSKPQSDASSLQICTVPKQSRTQLANVTWTGTEDLNGNVWFGGAGMPAHQMSTFTTTCVPGRKGMTADQNIHIIGFEPHMHRIGKHMSTSLKHVDGSVDMVFDQPFSFGSETHYPVDLDVKPGESLITSCTFDNDTDRGIPFGESSDSEMCYQFTWAYPAHALTNNAPSILGVPDTCW